MICKPWRCSRWFGAAVLLIALAASGCRQMMLEASLQDAPPEGSRGSSSRTGREALMNGQWQNRHFSELIAAKGEPLLIMHIPGGGNPPGFAAVYGVDPVTGCLDAFALLYGADPTIRVYHCR